MALARAAPVTPHVLRHTFITNLVRGGAPVKAAQTLATHSTIMLTMGRYTHLEPLAQLSALHVLPDLSPTPDTGAERARGTDGVPAARTAQYTVKAHETLPQFTALHQDGGGQALATSPVSTMGKGENTPENGWRRQSDSNRRSGICDPVTSASERHDSQKGQEKGQNLAELRALIEAWPGLDKATRRKLLKQLPDPD